MPNCDKLKEFIEREIKEYNLSQSNTKCSAKQILDGRNFLKGLVSSFSRSECNILGNSSQEYKECVIIEKGNRSPKKIAQTLVHLFASKYTGLLNLQQLSSISAMSPATVPDIEIIQSVSDIADLCSNIEKKRINGSIILSATEKMNFNTKRKAIK